MSLSRRWALAVLAAVAVAVPNAFAEPVPGQGSIGGVIGVPFMLADQDTKGGSSPRLLGQFDFQYVLSTQNRLSLQFGYGWVGYGETPAPYAMPSDDGDVFDTTKKDMITKFQPITASFLRAFKPQGEGWVPYAGGGINLHRMEIANDRKRIQDPVTFKDWVVWSWGVQARAGVEYFLSNDNVSFDWSTRWAYQFSESAEELPSGYTNPDSYITLNFGVNVYFWPIGHKPVETAPDQPAGGTPADAPLPNETPAPAGIDTLKTPAPTPAPDDTVKAPTPAPAPAPVPAPGDTVKARTPPPPTPGLSSVSSNRPDAAKSAAKANDAGKSAAPPRIENDEAEACPLYDIGPMLGVPSTPRHDDPADTNEGKEESITP